MEFGIRLELELLLQVAIAYFRPVGPVRPTGPDGMNFFLLSFGLHSKSSFNFFFNPFFFSSYVLL